MYLRTTIDIYSGHGELDTFSNLVCEMCPKLYKDVNGDLNKLDTFKSRKGEFTVKEIKYYEVKVGSLDEVPKHADNYSAPRFYKSGTVISPNHSYIGDVCVAPTYCKTYNTYDDLFNYLEQAPNEYAYIKVPYQEYDLKRINL